MNDNPLRRLSRLGQSVWLDDLTRDLLSSGTLARFVNEDGVSGVTSNPAIFEKAMSQGAHYDVAIGALARAGTPGGEIYEALALADVRDAADLLRPAFEKTNGADGFVSLEVSPHLADDTPATVAEARRLWAAIDRPNAMVKVPGTLAGLPAITALVADGVNINVTLLFDAARYRRVAEAYGEGLERRIAAGRPLASLASVASFFLSRIDTLIDARLDALGAPQAHALRGHAAIASARIAHAAFRELQAQPRWQRLAEAGARPQRLLWASTSTKDPAYPDTMYVEPLIGAGTVNTMPRTTIDAYRDHGDPAPRLEQDLDRARSTVADLAALGIDLAEVGAQLEREGVRKFVEPFDALLQTLEKRAAELR